VTENRQFHKFIIITIIIPSTHDSVIRRENALGAPVRSPSSSSCCAADLHVLNGFGTVRASCSTPNSSQAWTSASKSDRWLRWFRLQTLMQDFPPMRVDQAAGFSAHLQCRRSRRVRGYRLWAGWCPRPRAAQRLRSRRKENARTPDHDDLINRYQADLTKRGG